MVGFQGIYDIIAL